MDDSRKKFDEYPFARKFTYEFTKTCERLWTVKVYALNETTLKIVPIHLNPHVITLEFHPADDRIVPIATVTYKELVMQPKYEIPAEFETSVTLPTIYKNIPIKKSAEKIIVLLQLLSKIKTINTSV